jgi:hypothetical protein
MSKGRKFLSLFCHSCSPSFLFLPLFLIHPFISHSHDCMLTYIAVTMEESIMMKD